MGVIYTPPRPRYPWTGQPHWPAGLFRPGTLYRTRKGLVWEGEAGHGLPGVPEIAAVPLVSPHGPKGDSVASSVAPTRETRS